MTFYEIVVEAPDFNIIVTGKDAFDLTYDFVLENLVSNSSPVLYYNHQISGALVQKLLNILGCPVEIRKEEDIISVHRSVDCTNLFAIDKNFTLSIYET